MAGDDLGADGRVVGGHLRSHDGAFNDERTSRKDTRAIVSVRDVVDLFLKLVAAVFRDDPSAFAAVGVNVGEDAVVQLDGGSGHVEVLEVDPAAALAALSGRVAVILHVLDADVVLVGADDILEEPAEIRDGALAAELASEEASGGAVGRDGHLAGAAAAEDAGFTVDETASIALPSSGVALVLEARFDELFVAVGEGDVRVDEDGGARSARELEEEAVDGGASQQPSLGGLTGDESVTPRKIFEDTIEESVVIAIVVVAVLRKNVVVHQEGDFGSLLLLLMLLIVERACGRARANLELVLVGSLVNDDDHLLLIVFGRINVVSSGLNHLLRVVVGTGSLGEGHWGGDLLMLFEHHHLTAWRRLTRVVAVLIILIITLVRRRRARRR